MVCTKSQILFSMEVWGVLVVFVGVGEDRKNITVAFNVKFCVLPMNNLNGDRCKYKQLSLTKNMRSIF